MPSLCAVVNNPELTIAVLSHTRPIAKGFLQQVKREFETNEILKSRFSDVLWANPERESPKWSEDAGLIVKRKTNPKESSLEAHGLIDGMPTGRHFFVLNYDDVVVPASVTSGEMIEKTTNAWDISPWDV
jgi:hypothetical protein